MKDNLSVILCSYAHLPSGTDEAEFEALYSTAIKPLISSLEKYPRINLALHYSGVILYWIERRHPEFFMLLEDIFQRKQVEILGGGFYNPVLPLLPQSDKIGQIEMLSTYLRKHFGKRPQGCWLPSMTWEQSLVGPLSSAGMNYTLLEDQQFIQAGIKPGKEGIFCPCITEDQGKIITVFPVAGDTSTELSRGNPLDVLERLKEKKVITLSITKDIKAFDELFASLSKADSCFEFTTPSRIIKKLKGLKTNYFPGIWTLKCSTSSEIHPRQILAKYPEASGIYAKTMYVHTLINNQLRGDKTRKSTATEELWKAQDSGLYRLGLFSQGLYHAPIRKAAYKALLEAEKITREKIKFTPSLSVFDYDLDGEGEYILQDDKLNCFIKTKGAGIFELDYLPGAWNYLDTMSTTREEQKKCKRCAFTDLLISPEYKSKDISEAPISGSRICCEEEYEVMETDRVRVRAGFKLPPRPGLSFGAIEIEKTWQLKKNTITVDYILRNTGSESQKFTFSPSLDLSFPGEGKDFLRILTVKEGVKECTGFEKTLTASNIKTFEFQDLKNETVITLESGRSSDFKIFNVYAGLEGREEYQSTCIMPLLPVHLDPGKTLKVNYSLKISS